MDSYDAKVELGRTGLKVSRVGFGSSFHAPTASYERAFERGINYFYWGSLRRDAMGAALRNLSQRHQDDLVVVLQSYSRSGWLLGKSTERALKQLTLDRAQVLLLGWFNDAPPRRIIDAAVRLKERGLVEHIAISSHRRTLFSSLLDDQRYGIWHLRYNAVHRGAEAEVFPHLGARDPSSRPGIVTYTNTRWGHLCDPKRVPAGERVPTGTDCYRFALSTGRVDVAICGPDDDEHVRQAEQVLDLGPMTAEELEWMRRVGDHIYGKDRTSTLRDGSAAVA